MAVYFRKKSIFIIVIAVVFLVIAIRLFSIQIIHKEYRITAENNALKYETQFPARGRIIDRNGLSMVDNKMVYDIMVTPIEVTAFDTLALCDIFELDKEYVVNCFEGYKRDRRKIGYGSVYFLKHISSEQYNYFVEQSFHFPGFSASIRSARRYPYNAGGNLIGYVSEVDQNYIRNNEGYKSGDYAGKTGIEQAYESRLRGEKGYTIYLRDAHNQIKEHYEDGQYDKEAVAGEDLNTSIDVILQAYGEALMKNKVGSLVAIEPSTGEVLTLISSPGIDVSQLDEINKHYSELVNNPLRPMFNRTVQSAQPPGSVFKLVNGLIALQEGVITENTMYPCHNGFTVGSLHVGCHSHPSPLNLKQGIMMSCNSYFCYTLRAILDNPKYESVEEALTKWHDYVASFGFGSKLGSDIPYELGGNIPSAETYNKMYGKKGWRSLSVISLSIGQGEFQATPLHLANLCATVANRGYYYTPHIIRGSEEHPLAEEYTTRHYTMVDTSYFSTIVDGMEMAVYSPGGTASVARIPGVVVCGKTGTAQNPHGDDHSVFICFAPKDNPKIAVAAYIENGGFGATWAAPIASLLMEKYLNGEISPERKWQEQRVLDANLLDKVKTR
ncbi:MAG: penicillin-binding protein 2 [Bacteroidales bacterium]|nr:penicillin-binding protein 2 [Bacteroidales bacterium]